MESIPAGEDCEAFRLKMLRGGCNGIVFRAAAGNEEQTDKRNGQHEPLHGSS